VTRNDARRKGEVVATDGKLEVQLTQAQRSRLERAAAVTGEPVEALVRRAALDLAEELLRERSTAVPREFFDRFLTDPEEPTQP
jgi:uncharacterized protein (DUF1778 family)